MTTLTGVPRSMLLTTRCRVEEHAKPDRLFQDPLAVDWWQSIQWDAELDRFYDPIVQFSGAHRAKLFDQIVSSTCKPIQTGLSLSWELDFLPAFTGLDKPVAAGLI
jgi:O-methyltransferase involved in polyketide biosynthesis